MHRASGCQLLALGYPGNREAWHEFSGIPLNMPRRKSSLVDDLVLVPWWVSLILAIVASAFLIRMPLPWAAFAPFALLFFLATVALSALRSIKPLECWRDKRASHRYAGCRGNGSKICSAKHIDVKATRLKKCLAAVPMAAWI